MSDDVLIRPELQEDCSDVRRVNEEAFGQVIEADLVDTLRSSGDVDLSLVAERGGRVVGHILFSRVELIGEGGRRTRGTGLAPMSVLPDLQRRGIGSRLVRDGLDHCRESGQEWVVVLGHPDYYPRFGFSPASRFGIRSEYEVPDDVFLALELRRGALAGGGLARYAAPFRDLD